MICSISSGHDDSHPCMQCGELFTLAELYPNKGLCEDCISGIAHESANKPKNYPKKKTMSRDQQIAMSVNRLFDNSDDWLDDEPWRKW